MPATSISRADLFRDLAEETDPRFASISDQVANSLGADLCGMARDSNTDAEFGAMLGVLWTQIDDETQSSLFGNDIKVLDLVARQALLAYCADEQLRLNLGP